MACNSLAVQAGEMSLDLMTALKENEQAPEAARHLLAEVFGVGVEQVRYYAPSAWQSGMTWATARGSVRLNPDGTITLTGTDYELTRAVIAELSPKVEAVLKELGIACWQEASVQKIAKVAKRVKSDTWDERRNVRTLTFTI